jgi:hypothetical protein
VKPDSRFQGLPKHFWANVRTISQQIGYTDRATSSIRVPSQAEMKNALVKLELSDKHLFEASGSLTALGLKLTEYFAFRAQVINQTVRPLLMDVKEAEKLFRQVRISLKSKTVVPMNKQKGKKKKPAFLTGMVNMIVDAHRAELKCELDPRRLTSVTADGMPLRTLARRVDGAFPSAINPIAVWEIKEYYYTTTFGSRVADGVYETLLDGMELEELRQSEGVDVKHCLILDDRFTWWDCGRSYLCRIIDMLHMGYVGEVLFGREVVDRLPSLVGEWVQAARFQKKLRKRI